MSRSRGRSSSVAAALGLALGVGSFALGSGAGGEGMSSSRDAGTAQAPERVNHGRDHVDARAFLDRPAVAEEIAGASSWAATAQRNILAAEYGATVNTKGLQAPNRENGLRTYFDRAGVRIEDRRTAELLARLELSGLGRSEAVDPVGPGTVSADGARVEIARAGLVEWYENGPAGLEQGFTIAERPAGAGPLVLEIAVSGARASLVAQTVTLASQRGRPLTYEGLVAIDDTGAVRASRIEVPDPGTIRLVVDDAGATYPLLVDPVVSGTFDAMLESNVPDPPGIRPVAFGFWVHGAGDVNGDGFDDVIVGAPNYDNGEFFEGAAFVFLGSADGIVGADPTTAHAVLDSNQAAARLGTVSTAGDVNGDGFDDIMVGAPDYSTLYLPDPTCQCEVNGAVFVFHGGPNGITGTDPSNADATILGNELGSDLGFWLSEAGDVNGDGFGDIAISVPSHGTPFPPNIPPNQRSGNIGAIVIYHGGPSGITGTNFADADHTILSYENTGQPEPTRYGQLGNVDGAGDVNGDGFDDIVTGGDEMRLFLGSPGGIVGNDILGAASRVDADPELGIADHIGGPGVGIQARGAGDINGDGFADVVGSLLGYTIPGSAPLGQGQIFGVLGGPSGLGITSVTQAHFLLTGSLGGEWLGWGIDGAGDVDNDGFDDVVATARVYPGSFDSEGVVYLFRGSPQGIPVSTLLDADSRLEARQSAATTEEDLTGIHVAPAGDVNGDGFADVIAGKPAWDGPELNEGAAFVWHGEPWPANPNRFPVANAGTDQVLFDHDNDGFATAMLDGNASFDPDGAIVAFEWYEGETLLGTGAAIPAPLSATGDHILALVVTDDQGVRRGDLVRVRVEAPTRDFLYFDNFDLGLIEWTTTGDVTLSSLDPFPDPPQVRFAGSGATMSRTFALPPGATGAAPDFLVKLDNLAPTDRFFVRGSVDGGPFQDMLTLTSADATGGYVFYGGSGTPASVPVNMSWWPSTGTSFELRFEAELTTGLVFLDSFDIEALIVPTGNNPPIADAGPDQTLTDADGNGFEQVSLDGSGSSDPGGSIFSYEWREAGSVLANTPTFATNFAVGAHTVSLTVTDDQGGTDTDEVIVTIQVPGGNQPPLAIAGPNQSAGDADGDGFESFLLDGTASSDADGTIVGYEWREGATVLGTGATLPVTFPVGGHTVELIVTDDGGATGTDTLVVTVTPNLAPVAQAGADQTVNDDDFDGSEVVTVDGSASVDNDGTIVGYEWREAAIVLGSTASLNVSLAVGTHTLTLEVTDNGGATATDSVVVTVTSNQPPVADAGPDQTIVDTDGDTLEVVTFDGSASFDPDGTIVSWNWTKNGNPFGNTPTFSVTQPIGVHTVDLTVTDDQGSMATDTVVVTVDPGPPDPNNQPPVADAGPDLDLVDDDGDGLASAVVDGTGSSDPDGTISGYEWRLDGALVGTSAIQGIAFPVGTNTLELTVFDDQFASGTDVAVVNVAGNAPPTAVAGADQTVIDTDGDGTETVPVDGSASSDPDGTVVSWTWREDGTVLATTEAALLTLAVGAHTIELSVTDNGGATALDTVSVTVDPAASGAIPAEAEALIVDGIDPVTGNIALSFAPACRAADHNIVYGPLSGVAGYAYSGQVCGIGSSGSYTAFQPGAGSYFFLVVGTDGLTMDGSYGKSSAQAERPEDTGDPVCSFTQQIGSPCNAGDTTPPVATLTQPTDGATLGGVVGLAADATDDVAVTEVRFYVDSVEIAVDSTAPYGASWDTTLETDGPHTVSASAFDAAGNRGDSTIASVTVDNATLSVGIQLTGVPATIPRGDFFAVSATAQNDGTTTATGLTVEIDWSPQDPLKLENPQTTTQSYGALAPGSQETVQWEFRGDKQGTSTITITLRDAQSTVLATDEAEVEVLD